MELFAELDEYHADLAEGAGFRVLVHDQKNVPQPHEEGINVPVGFYSNIGVRRVRYRALSDI